MGPITDEATRRYLTGLLGDTEVETATTTGPAGMAAARSRTVGTRSKPAASARDLQQLGRDRAILVDGRSLPAVVTVRPWWERATTRRRGVGRA